MARNKNTDVEEPVADESEVVGELSEALIQAQLVRKQKAEERKKMNPSDRAKMDFMELVNDAGDRILNGGRRTIAGACGRFSTVNRETGTSVLDKKILIGGIEYLEKCLVRCREVIEGGREADGGFTIE